ncbi:hypothetical protein, conserved [Plasmodium gonderi]|uniref:Uncharacterized protein n=1 Tax=Plasmodium gonderi TaxID=77519 RepID=A0A1Y1JGX2_PLAGO|nr:hypothetical protein, conserved [Plasmodium gonderi]GAW81771.1 hypothetical protein, conserved [Plasmodium gonderi]
MNSKILEVLNLIEEKSFKKCEKVITSGLKGKKNEKIYLLLKCLLHSYVNEIKECKEMLESVDIDDLDENSFYILRIIFTNLNEGGNLISLYEHQLKKAESNKHGMIVDNVSNDIIRSSGSKVLEKQKIVDIEIVLKNLFDYCLNTNFFKKGSNLCLKLYKNTCDSKYLLYNSYLLYMNNSNNNPQIYNLSLSFLKNYKCYSNNKVTENFSFFLVFFFNNIKLRNYEECVKILEYAKSNNFFLNPLQYQVYKLYTNFIFNKLNDCIDVLISLIKELSENSDYYILYIDLIIYLLNKNDKDLKVENVFNLYKNDLMYLEFFQKCLINVCVQKLKAFPQNISTFWNCIENKDSDSATNSERYFKDVMNLVLSFDREDNNNMNDKESLKDDTDECSCLFENIINTLEKLIEEYKTDVMKIYEEHDVKIYIYMLLSFVLKESKNYNLFYSIKNHLSLLKDDMIAILIVFIKIVLKKLYVAISTEMKTISSLSSSSSSVDKNDPKKEVQKNVLQFYKQIYNFEKLLYVLYKKDVHESFNRIFSMFIQVTNNMDLKLRDDNFVVLLVEMALYLDKHNLCQCEQKCNLDDDATHMYNLLNEKSDSLNLRKCKTVDEFLGPIGIYDCAKDCKITTNSLEKKDEVESIDKSTTIGAPYIPNITNETTNIFDINSVEKNERNIPMINRSYYIAALSVLKYSYNYRIRMTEKENEEKKVKPILNNDYINVVVLMIYLNNVIGNFTKFSTLIEKLNIKNIQLITYSPILFIHTYNYSYFSYAENLLKNILNYYNVQQGNLKSSVSKCFQNNSIFKVNEIVNAYFLNSSNIIFYFIKLLYIFKKQLDASRVGFYFNLFGSVKKDYPIHNEHCTKFPPMNNGGKGNNMSRNRNEKLNGIKKATSVLEALNHQKEKTTIHTDVDVEEKNKLNGTNVRCTNQNKDNKFTYASIKNDFLNMLKKMNEDILDEEHNFKNYYSKLMLDKFNFLTIDNQTILIKYNIPSFRFTLYKSFDTFFYNHMLYETLNPVEEFQFLKDIKILNTTEANSVNLLKDIKTVYPMIMLSSFYNLKGSVYVTSHENILDYKNMGDVLQHSGRNVSQDSGMSSFFKNTKESCKNTSNHNNDDDNNDDNNNIMSTCGRNGNDISYEKIKEHADYSVVDHEINFFTNNNIYVSFDKDNYNYRNKYIFKWKNKPKFQFNENSFTSPFNTCLTELFNYPIQTLYLNAIILNTVMYLFHKSFYFYSFSDESKKLKLMNKSKCAFLYLTYIISYYQLTESLNEDESLYLQKELDEFTIDEEILSFRRESGIVNHNESANGSNSVESSVGIVKKTKTCVAAAPSTKDSVLIDPVFKKKYGEEIFKRYNIMQAAYHNDIYSKSAALYYKSLLLNLNMYLRILAGDKNIKEFTDKLQFLDNIIYLYMSNELNVFKQLLKNDTSCQIINLSCLFKQYNYVVHNITIFTLTIQSIYNQGKKKVSSENNMLIKNYLVKKIGLLSDINKNLLSLSEVLDNYSPVTTLDVLKNFELELLNEIAVSCKQHVLNLYNLCNGKVQIIKSYL